MNVREKITAAAGSIALNLALVLVLSQGARAATPSAMAPAEEPHHVLVYRTVDRDHAQEHCESSRRTREIVAVILAMIV